MTDRLTVAHLPCGYRVVLIHVEPRRWEACEAFHGGATRLGYWAAHRHEATVHSKDERATCADERCRDVAAHVAKAKRSEPDEREMTIPFVTRAAS